jgi:hypothetical protein
VRCIVRAVEPRNDCAGRKSVAVVDERPDNPCVSQRFAPAATPLKLLALHAKDLDAAAFAGAHGEAFFVLVSSPFPMRSLGDAERMRLTTPQANAVRDHDTGEITIGVFPLKKRIESTHPFISIGRTDDNDIAIHDETVSRFHAYVRWDHQGQRWLVQDARSKNGTTVDGVAVPRRGDGDPMELKPGSLVMFGSVSLHFADVNDLWQLMKRVA